jgi:hypothetical protein
MNHRKFKNLIKLGPSNMADALERLIKTNSDNKETISVSLAITGVAGIGKTSLVEQVSEKLGYPFHKISLTNMQEVNDLIGFPMKSYQMRKDSEEIWVPKEMIDIKMLEGYIASGKIDMSYAKPEWVPKEGSLPVVLALDDYSRAMPHILQATMEIVDRQEYVSWKLPKGSTVVLTTNPSDDNDYMGVNELGKAQSTRFIELGLKFDKNDWAMWAAQAKIDDRCIDFLLTYPELVEGSEGIPPRMFEKFFRVIEGIDDWGKAGPDRDFVRNMGSASIGPEATHSFEQYVDKGLDKTLSAEEVFKLSLEDLERNLREQCIDTSTSSIRVRQDVTSRLMIRILGHLFSKFRDTKKVITDSYIERLRFLETIEAVPGLKLIGPDSWTLLADAMTRKAGAYLATPIARKTDLLKKAL